MASLESLIAALRQTWPARLAESAGKAVMAPGNAYRSTPDNPVTTEEMIAPAADLAGLVTSGSFAAPAMNNAVGMGLRTHTPAQNLKPAVSIDGRIFTGLDHADAVAQASKKLGIGFNTIAERIGDGPDRAALSGFALNDKFLTRPEAARLVGKEGGHLGTEDLPLPPLPAPRMGIRAYHGSPHDFDKFDLSKIGTGEGAQAYGHGLYFAENPATATAYKNSTSDLAHSPASLETVLNDFRGRAAQMKAENHWNAQGIQDIVDALEAVKAGKAELKQPGKMYEVNINAAPEQFLDWDKPLSQQPAAAIDPLLETVKKEAYGRALASTNKPRADQLWSMVKDPLNAPAGFAQELLRKPEITQGLNQAGIPGIKYLDQGSRGSGAGTNNYVVFNPDIIDILKKYGLAGVPAAGALSNPDALVDALRQ